MSKKEEFSRGDPESYKRFYFLRFLNYLIPICIAVVGVFITTQKFAPMMNYDPRVVGKPLYVFKSGYRLYNPLVFLMGMVKFAMNETYSYYFFQAAPPAIFSLILAFAVFLISSIILNSHQKNQHIHGTARWATVKDLKEIGHLQRYGVVCGELEKADVYSKINREKGNLVLHIRRALLTGKEKIASLICHSGALNTWMIAPTGSGKGVSAIIPTCINYGVPYWAKKIDDSWKKTRGRFLKALKFIYFTVKNFFAEKIIKGRGSIVVFDPKGENYEATAGWRSKFSVVIPFAPLDENGNTAHYNPLHEIPDNPKTAFAWADMIANIFFEGDNKGGGGGGNDASAYFNNRARDVLTGVILSVRFDPDIPWKQKNMSTVLTKISEKDSEYKKKEQEGDDDEEDSGTDGLLEAMKTIDHGSQEINDLVRHAAQRLEGQPVKERGSTYSTIFSKISLFQDPLLANATAYSDFTVDDFINGKNGISLYLIVPYGQIQRINPVFRMLITFMLKKFSDGTTNANAVKLKNPCLFLLDEFPVLGYFPDIALNMGILRGYGVTFFIVSQSMNQIADVYGHDHPFFDHCKTKIIYAPGNINDAKMVSELIGNRSVLLDNISTSMGGHMNANYSSQEVSVSLANPDELMKLEYSRCIVLLEGKPPYKGKKVVYYEDPRFRDKAFMEIPKFEHLMKTVHTLPSNRISHEQPKKTAKEKIEGIDVKQMISAEYDVFTA